MNWQKAVRLGRVDTEIQRVVDAEIVGGQAIDTAVRTLIDSGVVQKTLTALAAVDTAGGVAAWQNPESTKVVALPILIVTTIATDECTIDVGVAANGTTSSDTQIDGQDVNGATGVFVGTWKLVDENGGSSDWITASKATGATAGIVGKLIVIYAKYA